MVSRQDVRNVNEASRELQEALDEMRDLHEKDQNPDVTVDPAAFAEAQERAKEAVADLVHSADDAVDRTDVFEPDDADAADVSLPNAALARDGSSTTKPSNN